eukprot:CAMPEP_0177635326 /NCGR_PEP_ID=MMETSP0447-20121125/3842_1 /TAXON_ID=0 /ORGANISM="Stygamoeba regulata, Strain BSH-02190019" /LENGTH=179 /DNA_ID=CAMNT_0019137107 /DNA_START=39 /DNA_END=578 /DNA_ORIENTATION=+
MEEEAPAPAAIQSVLAARAALMSHYQRALDMATPHIMPRWVVWLALLLLFAVRVWVLRGFYIVAYAFGIYMLNLFIGFLSPAIDPELEGPSGLPDKASDEFKPFVRRLPEFKFWHASFKAVVIALACTLSSIFNVPVFWPILVVYFFSLSFVMLRKQIAHMRKHKYLPFSLGKPKYAKG